MEIAGRAVSFRTSSGILIEGRSQVLTKSAGRPEGIRALLSEFRRVSGSAFAFITLPERFQCW